MTIDFKPVRSNLGQQAFEYLIARIYNMEIEPGSRLGVGEIAAQLEISRSPVRDAFHLLVAEGLIEYEPSGGYHVIQINRQYIEDIFGVRRALEVEALRAAMGCPNQERLAALCAAWQRLRLTSDDASLIAIHMDSDSNLHRSLGEMSGNAVLNDLLGRIIARAGFIRRWVYKNGVPIGHLNRMTEDHLHILDAMLAGDTETATEALLAHLENGKRLALARLED